MKRKILFTLFMPALMLVSCHKQEEVPSFSGSEIITVSPATCVTTKAPVDGKVFPDGRTFVMSASVNGSSTDYFKDAVFVKEGSVWKSDKYWPATGSLDFLALSCDTLSVGDISWASRAADTLTVSVPDNSSAQCDILHASAQGQSRSESGTPMTFRHTGSVVIYTAYSTVPYDSATNQGVTIRKITLKNAKHSGNLKVSAVSETGDYCTWSSLGSQKDVALLNAGGSENLGYNVPTTPMDITAEGNHFGIGGRGILVPEQAQTSFKVEYTLHSGIKGGVKSDVDMDYTYTCSDSWNEGKKYNYTLKFDMKDITVIPTVEEWGVEEEEVPIPEPVAAIYSVNNQTVVSLPVGVIATNSVISVDWGDGNVEVFSNKGMTSDGDTLKLNHTYASAFTGGVKLNMRKGSLDFGTFLVEENKKFVVIDSAKIKVREVYVLKFTADGAQKLKLTNTDGNAPLLEYSYDGVTWTQWNYTEKEFGVINGKAKPIYIGGKNLSGFNTRYKYSQFSFTGSGKVKCTGNVNSLLDWENPSNVSLSSYCYHSLFSGCTSLIQAPELPAMTLASYCYENMFKNCTSLIQAPELPATTLSNYCYSNMFQGCSSLTQAPELPATKLVDFCYFYMFYKCTSLIQAPKLPVTTLSNYCYSSMFCGCSSLTQAPTLPAMTLADHCYQGMFRGCSSLTQAPTLPAMTLANDCYAYMFENCDSLIQAPELPATIMAEYCYNMMFSGCKSLTQTPELQATTLAKCCYSSMFKNCLSLTQSPVLPAITLTERCYEEMFSGCSNLNHIKMLATAISATDCLDEWVKGVAASGTFVKNKDALWNITGTSGIPTGWTVVKE